MATPFTNGLRAMRIPTLRVCRPRLFACDWLLRRQLSTSIPRFSAVATAQHVPVADVNKPVLSPVAEEKQDERLPFSALKEKISKETLDAITVSPMKHTHMTPVQEAVLPMLPELVNPLKTKEDGSFEEPSTPRDIMVRAKTGTGKTLAFLVPAIEARVKELEEVGQRAKDRAGKASDWKLIRDAKRDFAKNNVGTLILSPTRELAKQIAVEAGRLSTRHDFKIHQFLGGESKGAQLREWRYGQKDIVVATTGRLRDLMDSVPEVLNIVKTAKLLILDEADTMLDIGFRPDIEYITAELRDAPERQTFIFSATIGKAVQQIARQTMSKNHVFINTVLETDSPVHAHIPQYHTVLSSAGDQLPHTLRLLAHDQLTNPGTSKVMIFLPTTKLTQLYATLIRELTAAVLPAGRNTMVHELHSKRSMESRTRTSDRFRHDNSGASVLITSDVSARGVDYPGVTRVIQLGIPASPDQYVHRIGRTGRAGSTQGRADLVLLPWEHGYIRDQLRGIPLKPVTSHDFEKHVHEIAEKHDEDPKTFFPTQHHERSSYPRKGRRTTLVGFPGRVAARLKAIKEEIDEVMSSAVEEDDIRETFASLLGFYVGKNDDLRASRDAILEGLREWAVQAGGLTEPPYVSETFLNRIGFPSDRSAKRLGRELSKRNIRQGSGANRWDGRGSRTSKMQRAVHAREEREPQEEWRNRRESNRSDSSSERRSRSWDGERSWDKPRDGDRGRRRDGERTWGRSGDRERRGESFDVGERGRRSSWPN